MLLTIDIGNSHATFGLFDSNILIKSFRIPTDEPIKNSKDKINPLFSKNGFSGSVDHIVMCSVVPEKTAHYVDYFQTCHKIKPLIVSCDLKFGIKIHYNHPHTLGTDRICTSVAAYDKYGGPVIVVDMGTATTVNCVNERAEFIGGMILPGIRTSFKSLASRTAQLPEAQVQFPPAVIGTDTITNIQSGILNINKYGIQGILDELRTIMGPTVKTVATGGWSEMLQPHIPAIQFLEPHLILDGMRIIFEYNQRV